MNSHVYIVGTQTIHFITAPQAFVP